MGIIVEDAALLTPVVGGIRAGVTKGLSAQARRAAWKRAAARGEIEVSPGDVRFTQRTAGGGDPPRAPKLREQMAEGWDPDLGPIDVIETPEGLLSLDNTRVAVAQELGIPKITARVHGLDDLLPTDFPADRLASFQRKAAKLGLPEPKTWGDLFKIRTQSSRLPATGAATRPRMPE